MTEADGDVRREMRTFIEDNFLYMHPDTELGDGDDLLKLGIIDSLGFVELVEEVQGRYTIEVEDVEITEQNFGSIEAIAALRRSQAVRDLNTRTLGEDLRAAGRGAPGQGRGGGTGGRDHLRGPRPRRRSPRRGPRRARREAGRPGRPLLPNGLEATIAIYGVFRAGAAISPLHPTVKAEKLAYVLENAGARALICDAERVETARAAADRRAGSVEVVDRRRVGGDRRPAARSPGVGRPRRGRLHLGLDRRAEGRRAHPRQHDLRRRLDHRVPGDGRDPNGCSACCRSRSATASIQLLTCVRAGATLVLEPGFAFAGRVVSAARGAADHGAPGRADGLRGAALAAGLAERELPAPARADQRRRRPARADGQGASRRPSRGARLYLDVRADRGAADLLPAARAGRRAPDLGRDPDPRHRGLDRGRRRQRRGSGRRSAS